MKKSGLIIAALGLAFTAAPALANLELATKSACTACHAVDKKLVGPAYKDVAAKYKGNPKAEAMLDREGQEGRRGRLGPDSDAPERQREGRRHQDAREVGPLPQVM